MLCSELFREPILLAVAVGHRLAPEPQAKLSELRGEKMLLLKEAIVSATKVGTGFRRWSKKKSPESVMSGYVAMFAGAAQRAFVKWLRQESHLAPQNSRPRSRMV
jgi:hypothetical protein